MAAFPHSHDNSWAKKEKIDQEPEGETNSELTSSSNTTKIKDKVPRDIYYVNKKELRRKGLNSPLQACMVYLPIGVGRSLGLFL